MRSGSPFVEPVGPAWTVSVAGALATSGVKTMDSLAGALTTSADSGPWARNHTMETAATPAAMLAPITGRAKRIQRSAPEGVAAGARAGTLERVEFAAASAAAESP